MGELQAGYFITPAETTYLVGCEFVLGSFLLHQIVTLHQSDHGNLSFSVGQPSTNKGVVSSYQRVKFPSWQPEFRQDCDAELCRGDEQQEYDPRQMDVSDGQRTPHKAHAELRSSQEYFAIFSQGYRVVHDL